MKVGVSVVGEVTLYKVTIQGRGGDSVHDEHFETEVGAIFASAKDGQNFLPTPVTLLKLSDGTLIKPPVVVRVSAPPTEQEMKKFIDGLQPAIKRLLTQKL